MPLQLASLGQQREKRQADLETMEPVAAEEEEEAKEEEGVVCLKEVLGQKEETQGRTQDEVDRGAGRIAIEEAHLSIQIQ